MTIPGTAKEIIEYFIQKHGFSLLEIANRGNIASDTIDSILKGKKVSQRTNIKLIQLYVTTQIYNIKNLMA